MTSLSLYRCITLLLLSASTTLQALPVKTKATQLNASSENADATNRAMAPERSKKTREIRGESNSLQGEYSVVGTIYGPSDQRAHPVAVIQDGVSKRMLVLRVGDCLPRHPQFCITQVERTEVKAADGQKRFTIRREPFGAGSTGGSLAASSLSTLDAGNDFPPSYAPSDRDVGIAHQGSGGGSSSAGGSYIPPPIGNPGDPFGSEVLVPSEFPETSYPNSDYMNMVPPTYNDSVSGMPDYSAPDGVVQPMDSQGVYEFIQGKLQRGEPLDAYEASLMRAQGYHYDE